jgi:hypothetical protein
MDWHVLLRDEIVGWTQDPCERKWGGQQWPGDLSLNKNYSILTSTEAGFVNFSRPWRWSYHLQIADEN